MEHRSKRCQRAQCTDKHPYHLHNGMILRSIRQDNGGLLMDVGQALELRLADPRFAEVRTEISQNDFDIIFHAGREDGLREGHAAGRAIGVAAGYRLGNTAQEAAASRLF